MIRESIIPTCEQHWLDLRKNDITSTMMPGLFGLSPYTTSFALYQAKKFGLELPFDSNVRMEKGKRIEGYAAREVALKEGWDVSEKKEYVRLPDEAIGSSFDFDALCPERGPGILEIKAVDTFQHKRAWSKDEIPAHIEIQARTQMLVSGLPWVAVAAFTSIYDFEVYFFEREDRFEQGLLTACRRFWEDVGAGKEPPPDYYRDGDVIAQMYKNASDDMQDFTGDASFDALVSKHQIAKKQADQFEKDAKAARNEIHHRLKDGVGAWSDKYSVNAGWTEGSPGKEVTADMVGEIVGARAGYRQLIVKELNQEKTNV